MSWCSETCTAQVMATAGYSDERGVVKIGEEWGPGRQFVGMIADYEGFGREDAVMMGCSRHG